MPSSSLPVQNEASEVFPWPRASGDNTCRVSTICMPSVTEDFHNIIVVLKMGLKFKGQRALGPVLLFPAFQFRPESGCLSVKSRFWENRDGILNWSREQPGASSIPWSLCFYVWLQCGACLWGQVEAQGQGCCPPPAPWLFMQPLV